MFVSLVKIKKYLIYLFLFLLFNCFFTLPIKAGGTSFEVEYNVNTIENRNLLRGIAFNTDGSKMFVSTTWSDRIEQFTLSVPFDLSSTLTRGTPLLRVPNSADRDDVNNPYSLQFNTDGTKMFFVKLGGKLYEYSLSTAFDISATSAAVDDDAEKKTLSNGNTTGFAFNADGTKLFAVDNGDTKQVDEYSLSTGFDITTISYETSLDISDNTSTPKSIVSPSSNSSGTSSTSISGALF